MGYSGLGIFGSGQLLHRRTGIWLIALAWLVPLAQTAQALTIGVAANFYSTAQQLAAGFERESGINIILIKGSSGKLAAQIRQGAPIDLLLSADIARPQALIEAGDAIPDSLLVYAYGQLALYSKRYPVTRSPKVFLQQPEIRTLAIANPELAPYGRAALEVLTRFGLDKDSSQTRLAAENVAQALLYVELGSADAGLVAYSMLLNTEGAHADHLQLLDRSLYSPIAQALVVTANGEREDAEHFVAFLSRAESQALIRQAGYLTALPPDLNGKPTHD